MAAWLLETEVLHLIKVLPGPGIDLRSGDIGLFEKNPFAVIQGNHVGAGHHGVGCGCGEVGRGLIARRVVEFLLPHAHVGFQRRLMLVQVHLAV